MDTHRYAFEQIMSTLADNWSLVARHILHFLSEKPTPILNSPMLCAANVSARANKTAPFTTLFTPWIVMTTPYNKDV